ncbi:MAG: extracellular solute-binding protein [Patescibacteria group bacterium]
MRPPLKHFSLSILLVTLLATAGFGCKGLSKDQQSTLKPVSLNFWTVYEDTAELNKLAAKYNKIYPHVKVNIRQVRYDEFENLLINALADDVAPDVVSMHTRWLNHYVNRLSVAPASVKMSRFVTADNLTKDTSIVLDTNNLPTAASIKKDYVVSVYNDAIIGGQVYGLPQSFDTLAVYYNKDLLDKANVPEAPGTWDEFLQAVKASTKFDKNGKILQAGTALGAGNNIDNATDILTLLMMQNGMEIVSGKSVAFDAGLKPETVANHPTLQALRFYTDFARPNKEAYTWTEEMGNALDSFTRGKVVFYFGFAYDLARIKSQAPEMNLEIISVPQLNPSAPVNVANYWIQSVPKKSKHQNEAWDFIRFISSPENVQSYSEATRRPSPFRAHIKEQKDNPLLAPFATQALIAKNWYNGQNIDVANAAIKDLITNFLKPYAEGEDKNKRDANLIQNAAAIVRQTM